jgi:hypothetical protein
MHACAPHQLSCKECELLFLALHFFFILKINIGCTWTVAVLLAVLEHGQSNKSEDTNDLCAAMLPSYTASCSASSVFFAVARGAIHKLVRNPPGSQPLNPRKLLPTTPRAQAW